MAKRVDVAVCVPVIRHGVAVHVVAAQHRVLEWIAVVVGAFGQEVVSKRNAHPVLDER